jgi:hypothetical protein
MDLAAVELDQMLIRLSPHADDPRKWRLFACGCCRQVWFLLNATSTRRAVERVEEFADGKASSQEVFAASYTSQPSFLTARAWAAEAVATLTAWDTSDTVLLVAHHAARALRDADHGIDWTAARQRQAALLLDIFGKLNEPIVLDPRWLSWNDATVRKMADTIYQEHRFADMPILADALEEAGCDRGDILDHCRQHPEHARGCWLLDAIRRERVELAGAGGGEKDTYAGVEEVAH